jgi:hypothetical protein
MNSDHDDRMLWLTTCKSNRLHAQGVRLASSGFVI